MSRQTFLSRFHVTKSGAFRAFDAVCRELRSAGLMPRGDELEDVCCEWHPVEIGGFGVTGFGLSDFTTEGYYWNRTIHIPAWGAWFGNCEGIRNVVRHEFGHAVADIYHEKMRRDGRRRAYKRCHWRGRWCSSRCRCRHCDMWNGDCGDRATCGCGSYDGGGRWRLDRHNSRRLARHPACDDDHHRNGACLGNSSGHRRWRYGTRRRRVETLQVASEMSDHAQAA